MKTLLINLFLLLGTLVQAQQIEWVQLRKDVLLVKDSSGSVRKLLPRAKVFWVGFNKNTQTLVYVRLHTKSNKKSSEGDFAENRLAICKYDIKNDSEQVLLTTCLDGKAGTKVPYGKSDIFPHEGFCQAENFHLSGDGQKLVFQTAGWKVSPAIHWIDIHTGSIIFLSPGWIKKIRKNGVELEISGIDPDLQLGRYTQLILVNWKGKKVKELGPKIY